MPRAAQVVTAGWIVPATSPRLKEAPPSGPAAVAEIVTVSPSSRNPGAAVGEGQRLGAVPAQLDERAPLARLGPATVPEA